MNARLTRIAWIRDTYNMVVGSEGGVAYARGNAPLRTRDDGPCHRVG